MSTGCAYCLVPQPRLPYSAIALRLDPVAARQPPVLLRVLADQQADRLERYASLLERVA